MKSVKNAYKTSVWNESGTNHSLVLALLEFFTRNKFFIGMACWIVMRCIFTNGFWADSDYRCYI